MIQHIVCSIIKPGMISPLVQHVDIVEGFLVADAVLADDIGTQ